MSLILIQETASSVPTPPSGKGTVFLTTSNELSVKDSTGNTSTVPTFTGAGNTSIFYNNAGSFGQTANLTFNETTNTFSTANANITGILNVTGNANIGNIGTGGLITVTGNILGGNLVTTGQVSATGNVTAAAVNANGTIGNGIVGGALTSGSTRGTGVTGQAYVTASADTGAAVGVRGYATDTHSGGYNIGVLANALGSGVGNYAFYVQNGGIASIENIVAWDLYDNSQTALVWQSTGKANILGLDTTNGAEGMYTSGYLNVTGNAAVGGIKTDNYYYANGSPVDFQQAGGSNSFVQFNDNGDFGGSANFTFNKTTNLLTISGNIQGSNLVSGGALSVVGNANIGNIGTAGLITATGNIGGGNINTGGVVSATGNGTFANVNGGNLVTANFVSGVLTTAAQPNITSLGTLSSLGVTSNANVGNLGTGGLITATGNIGGGNINTGGVVSATGTITGGNLATAGALSAGGNANVGNLGTGGLITATGNIRGGNLVTGGVLSVTGNANVDNIGTTNIIASGSANVGQINVTGNIIPTANITYDLGNSTNRFRDLWLSGTTIQLGSQTLQSNTNGVVVSNTLFGSTFTISGNVEGGNLVTGGGLSVTGNANIGNIGTAGLITATGNITGGNLTTAGVLSVSGTSVSSINGNLNMNSKYVVSVSDPVNAQDVATKNYVDQQVSTGVTYHQPVQAATTTTLAVATSGTTAYVQPNGAGNGIGAYISTTGTFTNIDAYNIASISTRILVKDEANAVWNGVYVYSNATAITRATDADEYGPNSAQQISLNDYFFVQNGTVNKGIAYVVNAPTGTIVFGTSNITFAEFSTSQVYTAGTGINISGTVISANASQTQITAVGTLTSLSVSGNANIGNIGTAGQLVSSISTGTAPFVVTSTTQVANLSVATAGSATTAGTVTTAAQPNITSVGTLTSLSVTGNANVGNIGAAAGVFTTVAGSLTTAAQSNITSVGTLTSVSVSGNANVGNIGTGGLITATGNIGGGNINTAGILVSSIATGTAPLTVTSTTRVNNLNVAYANVADNINVSAPGTGTGYIVTANATTGNVAEWTSLGVSVNLSNNAISATTFIGALSGAATSATTAGTVTTAAQPNITSTGTLTSLSSSGNITGANLIVSTSGSLIHSINAAVSAAGTVQGNATSILNDISVVTTCASGAGVVLPTAVAGMRKLVFNTTANACLVYPAASAQINGLGLNVSYSVAAGGRLEFVGTSTTQWYTLNATYA